MSCIVKAVLVIVICPHLLNGALIHDTSQIISVLSSSTFKHYDIVISSENLYDNFGGFANQNQVLFLESRAKLSNFITRSSSHKRYGRTALWIIPANISTFASYIDEVASLHVPGLGQNIDTRLYTFIIWPNILNDSAGNAEIEFMRTISLKFRLNAEVFILYSIQDTKSPGSDPLTNIYEFYSVGNVSIVQQVDPCWNVISNEQDCYILSRRFIRRRDFQGGIVRVTSVDHEWDQCVTSYKPGNGTVEFEGGISVQVLREIRNALNFTILAMKGGGYIWLQKDGYLGGVGGEVFFGSADITITLEYLINNRVERLSPLFPLFIDKTRAYFRVPEIPKNIFTLPFSYHAWVGLMILFGSIVLIIAFFALMDYKLHTGSWYSSEAFLLVIAVASQKGWYFDPPSISGRIVLITTLGFSVVCYIAYSSTIVATLTVDLSQVTSYQELLKLGFGIMFHPDHAYLFVEEEGISSGVSVRSNIPIISNEDAVGKVVSGGYVFLTTVDIFRPISRQLHLMERTCGSISSLPFQKALQNGFYVQKASPYKDFFNVRLLLLMENGVNFRYKMQKYANEIVECPINDVQKFGLDIEDVHFSFLILIFGVSISFVVFWGEKLVANKNVVDIS